MSEVMRALQSVVINLIIIPKLIVVDGYDDLYVKWKYIDPECPLKLWKYDILSDGEVVYSN